MDLYEMSKRKKVFVISGLIIPLIVCIGLLFGLSNAWSVDGESGERFSPVENRPLFVGLIIFTLGYVFFLGMLFSDNIVQLFNKRYHRY